MLTARISARFGCLSSAPLTLRCLFLQIDGVALRHGASLSIDYLRLGSGWLVSILASSPHLFFGGFVCLNESQVPLLSYYTIFATLALPTAVVAVCNNPLFWLVRRSTS